MFQFGRFPTYAYFIQRMLPEYCSGGFPHSEIHGSMDICSSPWLIAACHVLLRLPVPRHSPCALCSLTFLMWANIVKLEIALLAYSCFTICLTLNHFVIRFSRSASSLKGSLSSIFLMNNNQTLLLCSVSVVPPLDALLVHLTSSAVRCGCERSSRPRGAAPGS